MCRHCIPDTSFIKFSKSHNQLTTFYSIGMNKFVDCSFVAFFLGTKFSRFCFRKLHHSIFILCMSRVAHHIKLCRSIFTFAFKFNFSCSFTDIKSIFEFEFKVCIICFDYSRTAYIYYSDLSSLGKIICGHFFFARFQF